VCPSTFKTSVSLVCLTEVELNDFGDVEKQLGEIGSVEQTSESPFVGRGDLFVEKWTCLALMTFQWVRVLVRDEPIPVPYLAKHATMALGEDITNHGQHRTGIRWQRSTRLLTRRCGV